jgi:metal-responsive CopG/Arc/MetJ family transcriptional regulator
MRKTLTISIPADLAASLDKASKAKGLSRSQYVQATLQQRLWKEDFRGLRAHLVPKARALGVYTDEDVFKLVS